MSELAVTAADIAAAHVHLRNHIVRTPSTPSITLSAITGATVVVKFENLQFTGSFKDRGAANKLRLLDPDERARGVIAMSAGNHAQGLAHHASRLGIPATIVMPEGAPFAKVTRTTDHGATVIQQGESLLEAAVAARAIAQERGLVWVHPYDDADVIAGQGTVATELLEDHPDLDAIIVPVGGGGLIAGVAVHVAAVAPHIDVVGVQTVSYPGMVAALAGEALNPPQADTLADGIAVKIPGSLTVPIVAELVSDVVTVSEAAIEHSVALYLEIEKTVAEGAGAAPLAALLEHGERFRGRRVGLILSGGNIDSRILASVLMRELAHSGRVSPLRITIADRPGALEPVVATIARAGANIIEIEHRRLFDPISARRTNIDVVIETRDHAHTAEVIEALTAAHFVVDVEAH